MQNSVTDILRHSPSVSVHSPSFSISFRPFSVILLCYSIPSHRPVTPRHSVTLGHSVTFRYSVTFRHTPSHPVISVTSHLPSILPFVSLILSHPFIFPYWDPTVSSSDLNLYSGSILVSATTPIIPTTSCSNLLLYSYFYCSMIRSVLIVHSVYILTSSSSQSPA